MLTQIQAPDTALIPIAAQQSPELQKSPLPKQPVIETKRQAWNFTIPPQHLLNTPLQLLTIGGICVKPAYWCGQLGRHYSAWAIL